MSNLPPRPYPSPMTTMSALIQNRHLTGNNNDDNKKKNLVLLPLTTTNLLESTRDSARLNDNNNNNDANGSMMMPSSAAAGAADYSRRLLASSRSVYAPSSISNLNKRISLDALRRQRERLSQLDQILATKCSSSSSSSATTTRNDDAAAAVVGLNFPGISNGNSSAGINNRLSNSNSSDAKEFLATKNYEKLESAASAEKVIINHDDHRAQSNNQEGGTDKNNLKNPSIPPLSSSSSSLVPDDDRAEKVFCQNCSLLQNEIKESNQKIIKLEKVKIMMIKIFDFLGFEIFQKSSFIMLSREINFSVYCLK
jgi:hypothetical protein